MSVSGVKNNKETNKLIIVESPTKARTITRFLGDDCKILACNGHIRTLPKEDLCIDLKNGYKPEYIEDPAKSRVISSLKSELKKADELILATDEDREGESISWHLLEVLKPRVPYRRMVFHEITRKAIQEAFAKGRDLDMNLVHAQEARRVLDRLYGYKISPVLWSKLSNKNLSAGRVQSPGLRLIVDREKVRLKYKKGQYSDIEVDLETSGAENAGEKSVFTARLDTFRGQKIATGRDFDSNTGEYSGSSKTLLLTREKADEVAQVLRSCVYSVVDIKEKRAVQRPLPPFTTSTLQQDGNRRLRMSAKDVMRIAQSLYENGLITYMRTDSTNLSTEGITAAKRAAEALCGEEFVSSSDRHYQTRTANAQEAHEAIRPAGDVFKRPEETGLSGRELALYTLIFNRTLATQMKDAVKFTTTVVVGSYRPFAEGVAVSASSADSTHGLGAGEEIGTLTASGTRIDFPGFLKVYSVASSSGEGDSAEDADDFAENPESSQSADSSARKSKAAASGSSKNPVKEVILPRLCVGEALEVKKIEEKTHETKAPARFTEASLVQELEKRGIGRPSTYAAIIDRILEKKYVVREGTALVPTFTAFGVVDLLEKYFNNRIDYDFTSQMEEDLDKISNGALEEEKYLDSFYKGTGAHQGLEEQIKEMKDKIDPKKVKRLEIPGLSEENAVTLGPYGPYVQTLDGKYVSVPESLTPAAVTDDMIEDLKRQASDGESKGPRVVGKTSGGEDILYCTGRYGDYWQTGNPDKKETLRRFSVPLEYKGVDVPAEKIERLLSLPYVVGCTESGDEIKAGCGRYGAYLQVGSDYRHLKDCEELLSITEDRAREIFSQPKESRGRRRFASRRESAESSGNEADSAVETASERSAAEKGKSRRSGIRRAATPMGRAGTRSARASTLNLVNDFGDYEGKNLAVRSGRYGFYLKYGDENIRIAKEYQHDEALCRKMTREEAISYLNK